VELLKKLIFIPLLLLQVAASSQSKSAVATKADQAPKIDGELDEAAWQKAAVATDFIQNFPNYGLPSEAKTEVRILYDNSAIYVGAYLYDDPNLISRQITARDEEQQKTADYFSVFLDTYDDKQNGFQFLVTSMNVQTDARLGPNLGDNQYNYGDKTWDAVWDSKVSMKPDGWIVEMRIPYLSLRFSKKKIQNWGLQLLRVTKHTNEISYWNAVDPNVNGFVNQFGELTNLQNIQPPLRLSLSPYLTGGVRISPDNGGKRTEWLRNGGMDVKYGINESFTLDATLIPDFGQVVSDDVINNLSPYEVRFDEHRPFFTEGMELFNKAGLFYSRRVGAMPKGYIPVQRMADNDPNIEVVNNPSVTQLYNAIKFSGRTQKKLGIGVFNAVTAPMHATVKDVTTGEKSKIETEPLTNYNILVFDQALKGRSYLTFTNTNVIRNATARDANVSALDFNLYDNRNVYNVKGSARYSNIFGNIPYDGFNTQLRAGKVSGKIQYYLQNVIKSDKYDPNDLGYLAYNNEISYTGEVSYNQFTPGKSSINYNYKLSFRYARLYDPNAFADFHTVASTYWYFKNFWDAELSLGSFPNDQHDYFVLRTPGRFVRRPAYWFASIEGRTDDRKRLFVNYEFLIGKFNEPDKNYHIAAGGVRYRFSNKLSLEVSTTHEGEKNYIIYAGREVNGEPIIAFVDFTDITSIFSGIYNFTPRINLTMRTRYYRSKVLYNSFANVDKDGYPIPRPFIPNQDENVNIFNVDAFLTWDFKLGSRVILGYKNWLGDEDVIDGTIYKTYLRNFGQLFNMPHGNEFTIKFIYFLDYNQLRKKK
jgi:hypothetical protein